MTAQRLGVVVYDRGGRPVARWDNMTRQLSFDQTRQGHGSCVMVINMPFDDSFRWYSFGQVLTLKVMSDGVVWSGRVEDIAIINGGIRVTAFGGYRALIDLVDTLFVAKTNTEDFETVADERGVKFKPDRFEFTNQGTSLKIAPRKGESMSSSVYGAFEYSIPHRSRNQLKYIQFGYRVELPSGWRVEAWLCDINYDDDDPATHHEVVWSLNSTGVVLSGSATVNAPVPPVLQRNETLVFVVYHNTPTPTNYAGETGTSFFAIESVGLYGDVGQGFALPQMLHVMTDLTEYVASVNPYDLKPSSAGVETQTNHFLTDLIWEDTTISEALETMMTLYTDPHGFGVDPQGYLWVRGLDPENDPESKTYYVTVSEFEIERVLESMFNAVYGKYEVEVGTVHPKTRVRRTEIMVDTHTVERYGLTRLTYIDVPSEVATDALEAELNDVTEITPRAKIKIDTLYTRGGASVPFWVLKGGDVIRVKNLPVSSIATFDKIGVFVVDTATYDAGDNSLEVELTVPVPSVARMLAEALR